ncbi:unnamed protein product [Vicia faba]|uniref:Uncharacterized protein n=1 Tax=Vicia faba TaxID=3906 RepID=A0AAV0ZLW4_VICFA|nr:unnamed protein product [Vicia faba]
MLTTVNLTTKPWEKRSYDAKLHFCSQKLAIQRKSRPTSRRQLRRPYFDVSTNVQVRMKRDFWSFLVIIILQKLKNEFERGLIDSSVFKFTNCAGMVNLQVCGTGFDDWSWKLEWYKRSLVRCLQMKLSLILRHEYLEKFGSEDGRQNWMET